MSDVQDIHSLFKPLAPFNTGETTVRAERFRLRKHNVSGVSFLRVSKRETDTAETACDINSCLFPEYRSILATARALDHSLRHGYVSQSRSSSTAKIALSFAQAIAATPFVLAVRHPGEFLPFLGGLDIVNMSIAKVGHSYSSTFQLRQG